MTPALALLASLVVAQAPAAPVAAAVAAPVAAPVETPVARGCPPGDVACLRRAYAAAGGVGMPADCGEQERPGVAAPEGRSVKDAAVVGPSVPCVANAPEGGALPWWAIGAAQWVVTLGLDLLPAVLFALTAVVAVLPLSAVPALLLLGLALGSIPGLSVVEAVATNLVGDVMGRGEHRGRLLLQVAISVAMLGVQVAFGAVALVGLGVLVNLLWVQLAAPEGRFVASQCGDVMAQSGRCVDQLRRVSSAGTLPILLAAGGTLAVVVGNLLIAVGLKGPVLAVAFWLHATHPWAAPWPRFLPRLALLERASPPAEQEPRAVASAGPTRRNTRPKPV